jgi:hypothetical protein
MFTEKDRRARRPSAIVQTWAMSPLKIATRFSI